ncbi:MAG TPA: dinitrogenase iron-molybdenum cofactor [Firmicutes bacterium]|nr:dinitrogenase iron-molybdenum cofactor [Bacillota bacterium]
MKIAVATEGINVSPHFGRCPEYTIFEIESGRVKSRTIIPNPGHEPGLLPRYLGQLGVSCIIAGGMGPRARGLFAEQDIKTITGVYGSVEKAVADYLAGSLHPGESACNHPQTDGCEHHC